MVEYPIGTQSFPTLINEGMLYVDKTGYIHNLIRKSRQYFLSRPRRFGKSLTLSTIESIFTGQKELFKGLAIDKLRREWPRHPVIHLSLSLGLSKTPEALTHGILSQLMRIARHHKINLGPQIDPSVAFSELLDQLFYQYTPEKVVVLIDEYDKPILDNIGSTQLAQILDVLKSFYSVLKICNEYLRFVFVTGVSKFSQVSIHSDLNHLEDISLDSDYATLCGYTQAELENSFAEPIAELAQRFGWSRDQLLAEIKSWYNGYRFVADAEPVYNPWSVLQLFKLQNFDCYWPATGSLKVEERKKKKKN